VAHFFGANIMSVQDVTTRSMRFPTSVKLGLGRLILGQVIAVLIVAIAGWNYWGEILAWVQTQDLRIHLPDTSYLAKLRLHVLVHIGAATTSLFLGAIVLYAPKGTANHKLLGRIWMLAMVTTSLSSFLMESFAPLLGQFGPIHLLSIWTLISMPRSIMMARKGNIAGHMQVMRGTYIGLLIAGLMTFIPGRTMFAVFFG
jgi:uncharacterized membrane protein